MATPAERLHPAHGELFTPITDDLMAFLDECYRAVGSWKLLAERAGLRDRQLRRMRNGNKTTCLSMRTVDRLIVASGVGDLDEWLWFTPEDLMRLGLWDPPQYVEGRLRIKGNERFYKPPLTDEQRKLLKRQRRAERKRRKRPDPATTVEWWVKFLGVEDE